MPKCVRAFDWLLEIVGRAFSSWFPRLCLLVLMSGTGSVMAHEGHTDGTGKVELGASAAADPQGNLWVVTKESSLDGQFITLRMSADLGKTWTVPKRVQQAPEPIAADGENRPKLAFGPSGALYITYTKPLSRPYTGEIRFIRSLDYGRTFSAPVTVHADKEVITHRFESLIVDRLGRIYIVWIDKRDVETAAARGQKYQGAALYYAVSSDAGASFRGDYKIADHSCECCRIALALRTDGVPVALWRHVFEPNIRDHAFVPLPLDGKPPALTRATFDDWRIDACPHHGPGLAYSDDGKRHQVWFNMKNNEGGIFYSSTDLRGAVATTRLGSAQAEHPDVITNGKQIAVVWKQFDGKRTAIIAYASNDGGETWRQREIAHTQMVSDQPHLVNAGPVILLLWNTQDDGVRVIPVR